MAMQNNDICGCAVCDDGVEDEDSHDDFVLVRKSKKGGWMSLKAKGAKFHSPIHRGCDCITVPEI